MTPTLNSDEIVVSLKANNIKSGDVIAFYYNNKILIKRVIAGPGDWVDIDDEGNVYVNDELLDEPYIQEKSLGDCNIELPYQVPDTKYFVMGDHRSTSIDSRNTSVGCVSEEQVVGRLVLRVWPLSTFGSIE
jgi:signal peptidase I